MHCLNSVIYNVFVIGTMSNSKLATVEQNKRDAIRDQYGELVKQLRSPEGPKQLNGLRRLQIRLLACYEAIADLQFDNYATYMMGFGVYHGAVMSNINTKIEVLAAAEDMLNLPITNPSMAVAQSNVEEPASVEMSPQINLHATNSDFEMANEMGRSDDEAIKMSTNRRRPRLLSTSTSSGSKKAASDSDEYTLDTRQSLSDGAKPRVRPSLRGRNPGRSGRPMDRNVFSRLGQGAQVEQSPSSQPSLERSSVQLQEQPRQSLENSQQVGDNQPSSQQSQMRQSLREMILSPRQESARTPSPYEPPNPLVQLQENRMYQTGEVKESPYCLCCVMYKQYHVHKLWQCERFLTLAVSKRRECASAWFICRVCTLYGHLTCNGILCGNGCEKLHNPIFCEKDPLANCNANRQRFKEARKRRELKKMMDNRKQRKNNRK